jgi:hypothetical protein
MIALCVYVYSLPVDVNYLFMVYLTTRSFVDMVKYSVLVPLWPGATGSHNSALVYYPP